MPPASSFDALTPERFETSAILKRLAAANRQLAELKGVSDSIPNRGILINMLGLQEAKDSSAIESIVTTHDELFRESLFPDEPSSPAAKEVFRYQSALRVGFDAVQARRTLLVRDILAIQADLIQNDAGFRRVPGTTLKNGDGQTIYTPPSPELIAPMMAALERFINDDGAFAADPLIKMALLHHQLETIHPFYDGNGRTGRIVNVLYLVQQRLLEIPILYMSRSIINTKGEYYRLLQAVRENDVWGEWVEYMLKAVEDTARDGIETVRAIKDALFDYKHRIRSLHKKIYSQDLIKTLFTHPYTKIQFVEKDLDVSRLTAAKYLDALAASGFLHKHRVGRSNYYVNIALYEILTGGPVP